MKVLSYAEGVLPRMPRRLPPLPPAEPEPVTWASLGLDPADAAALARLAAREESLDRVRWVAAGRAHQRAEVERTGQRNAARRAAVLAGLPALLAQRRAETARQDADAAALDAERADELDRSRRVLASLRTR
ncbi:hypothetical protein [Isoptericola dokdonensis]|uniref:Flagellar FliJ protein n=1 Tax=Isoptericola dokdonensis DS-3 TaxID=1300344 RepID=A0A161I113_9MICO|nr:hypothetical protein [Isoptericola dokdonensis]ANC30845.1 hypothetical protein I598_1285 [Isoptericola dokdonensis DS-3]